MIEPTTHKAEMHCGPRWDFFYIKGRFTVKLKKALTYEEQIDKLINVHNLSISDKDQAVKILKNVSYYRLSGYGIGLNKPDCKEQYKDGITLDFIYRLYCFDSRLKNILMRFIEFIEIQFRSNIANFLALKYGPEGYMNSNNFILKTNKYNKNIHAELIYSFQEECKRQGNMPFVKHHNEKYNGHFPIWVAIELFTFGRLCSLYSIMHPEDRDKIAKDYNTKSKHLSSWILSLVEVRNICAHYCRLYNMPLKQSPFLYSEHQKYRTNKIFPTILAIKRILKNLPVQWINFYTELVAIFDEYQDVIYLSYIGFPFNWKEVLDQNISKSP